MFEKQLYHFGLTPPQVFKQIHKKRPPRYDVMFDRYFGDQKTMPVLYDIMKIDDPSEIVIDFKYHEKKMLKVLTNKKIVTIKLVTAHLDKNGVQNFKPEIIQSKPHSLSNQSINFSLTKN